MIKEYRARVMVDPRGKIKTGMKAKTPEGKEYPRSLDYFNIAAFPELVEAYGEKPTAFVVKFPSDDPLSFFDCNFEHWGGRKADKEAGTLIRRCDGVTALHRINEQVGGKQYGVGEESPCVCQSLPDTVQKNGKEVPNPDKCKYSAYLKAWIVLPQTGKIDNPKCYLFETHSKNSGDEILSALNSVLFLTKGTLRGIPFSLSVKMVAGKTDAKQKFPIWSLLPIGTVTQMQDYSRQLAEMTMAPLAEVTASAVPLLKRAPGEVEDEVIRASRENLEKYQPVIKSIASVPELTRTKEAIQLLVDEGKLTQADYETLIGAMKHRHEALTKK